MVDAVSHTVPLDDYLKDVVQAVYSACGQAMAHLKDDDKTVDQALGDCEEVLGTVMAGKVDEWID